MLVFDIVYVMFQYVVVKFCSKLIISEISILPIVMELLGCSHYEIKTNYKNIHVLVLAINKATSPQDERIRKIKD